MEFLCPNDCTKKRTAATLQNCRVWITNEYEHNANKLGDGYKIMDRLIAMTRGAVHFAY
jgi:hypothetical protein